MVYGDFPGVWTDIERSDSTVRSGGVSVRFRAMTAGNRFSTERSTIGPLATLTSAPAVRGAAGRRGK